VGTRALCAVPPRSLRVVWAPIQPADNTTAASHQVHHPASPQLANELTSLEVPPPPRSAEVKVRDPHRAQRNRQMIFSQPAVP
jgi:hypothetical protein